MMIGYIMAGTNILFKTVAFYQGLVADLGAGRFMQAAKNKAYSGRVSVAGISASTRSITSRQSTMSFM